MTLRWPKKPTERRAGQWACLLAAGLMSLGLCSCRTPQSRGGHSSACPPGGGQLGPNTLPSEAWSAGPGGAMPGGALPIGPVPQPGLPLPQGIVTPWKPPGIAGPWPDDEYLWDGGEHYPVLVDTNHEAKGLEPEDTIVHYDTIDGRTVVEPSNRVVIYSPRFGAVRQVTAALASHKPEGLLLVAQPVLPVQQLEEQTAGTVLQPVQPVGEIGTKFVNIERLKQSEGIVSSVLRPVELANKLLPFEDFEIIRTGVILQSEKARLAESVQAAITWSHDQAVQAVIEKQIAHVETGDQRAQVTFTVDTPNHPRLRVLKIASTNMARPGEIVEFTIRYDNIGDQKIGNVTLLDNLTTRLEYVEGSAQSSHAAEFSVQPNEGDSSLVRWDFTDPLPAGVGGLVKFKCRVR